VQTPLTHTNHAPHDHRRVLTVVGPTASGKTALAEELAVRLSGEVVTADSMQVYRGMDIGTAKPPLVTRRVVHHLIDVIDPDTAYSAALYQTAARAAIADIADRGKLPVLAGGTGLYVRAALDDWAFPAGEQESARRSELEAQARDMGQAAFHAQLAAIDPASAALIHPNNVRRVVRAFELLSEGMSYAEHHAGFSQRLSVYDAAFIGLTMDRAHLYERIDCRMDTMMNAGLLEEVRSLLRAGYREALTASRAIGYKELVAVVDGTATLEEGVESIKIATRRYAKRQLTWFRADFRIVWIDVTDSSTAATADVALELLDSWLHAAATSGEPTRVSSTLPSTSTGG